MEYKCEAVEEIRILLVNQNQWNDYLASPIKTGAGLCRHEGELPPRPEPRALAEGDGARLQGQGVARAVVLGGQVSHGLDGCDDLHQGSQAAWSIVQLNLSS